MADYPPPKAFYRVQHKDSLTHYDDEGFQANARYVMNRCYRVNKEMFESHLDWKARPEEPTSYISMFDNLEDAQKRAHFHVNQGRSQVFIAKIVPSTLTLTTWPIHLANVDVDLPVWRTAKGDTFISTPAIRQILDVRVEISQESEWFAVGNIPASMIRIVWRE